jgi:hypothetical protein
MSPWLCQCVQVQALLLVVYQLDGLVEILRHTCGAQHAVASRRMQQRHVYWKLCVLRLLLFYSCCCRRSGCCPDCVLLLLLLLHCQRCCCLQDIKRMRVLCENTVSPACLATKEPQTCIEELTDQVLAARAAAAVEPGPPHPAAVVVPTLCAGVPHNLYARCSYQRN